MSSLLYLSNIHVPEEKVPKMQKRNYCRWSPALVFFCKGGLPSFMRFFYIFLIFPIFTYTVLPKLYKCTAHCAQYNKKVKSSNIIFSRNLYSTCNKQDIRRVSLAYSFTINRLALSTIFATMRQRNNVIRLKSFRLSPCRHRFTNFSAQNLSRGGCRESFPAFGIV